MPYNFSLTVFTEETQTFFKRSTLFDRQFCVFEPPPGRGLSDNVWCES